MKYLIGLTLFCFSCANNQSCNSKVILNSKLPKTKKELIYERMKSKDFFQDTMYFNDFEEYLEFIPELKLPTQINSYKINRNPDTISFFLQGGHCNYGPSPCVPLVKIERHNFVSIIYSGQTSGNELLLFNYDYKGIAIDSFEIFKWDALGSMTEKCFTSVDTNLNIKMKYSVTLFKSYDSKDTLKIINIERVLRLTEEGKIKVIKNESIER